MPGDFSPPFSAAAFLETELLVRGVVVLGPCSAIALATPTPLLKCTFVVSCFSGLKSPPLTLLFRQRNTFLIIRGDCTVCFP